MMNRPALLLIFAAVTLALTSALPASLAAESSPPPAPGPTNRMEETNSQSQEMLQQYLQLQQQIHEAQLAVEQSRQEAKDAAEQAAKAMAGRLEAIEQALASQRARESEVMQSSNRVMLMVAGTSAAVGFAAMLLIFWFHWRAVNRLAKISAALSTVRSLGPRSAVAALGSENSPLVTVGPAEQSSLRLLGAMERLEKRIYELEHGGQPHLAEGVVPGIELQPSLAPSNGNGASSAAPAEADQITLLLAKGESMLSLDNAEAALACFDKALALNPDHSEALVKKGSVMERLQRLDEAIACYDQAIAVDPSMTIAYLHKGGLFNRMERFNEALECYEKALHTQQKQNS